MEIICQIPLPDLDAPFGLDELGREVPNPSRESQTLIIKNPWKQALVYFPGNMLWWLLFQSHGESQQQTEGEHKISKVILNMHPIGCANLNSSFIDEETKVPVEQMTCPRSPM